MTLYNANKPQIQSLQILPDKSRSLPQKKQEAQKALSTQLNTYCVKKITDLRWHITVLSFMIIGKSDYWSKFDIEEEIDHEWCTGDD